MRLYGAVTMLVACGLLVGSASAGVVVGGTDTFTAGGAGADWGVGGPDGWQVDLFEFGWSNNDHREYFGSTGQILTDNPGQGWSKGQPDPGSHSGDAGTLAVQHMAVWSGSPTAPDPLYTSNQIKYITFPSVLGVTYKLSRWVNTTQALTSAEWNLDKNHPRIVDHGNTPPFVSQFADIQIGLKNGAADSSDLSASWTPVTGLLDNHHVADAWVQTPTVTAVGDGGPMTIILSVKMLDVSTGAKDPADNYMWDLDVRFDDITITPEPASLGLLGLGFLFVVRRRR